MLEKALSRPKDRWALFLCPDKFRFHRTMSEPNTPCADQTATDVEQWLGASVREGLEVVIRETQYGLLKYRLARVVRLGKGRFDVAPVQSDGTVAGTTQSFYRTGKNCWEPKGQTRLVMPTAAVVAACAECSNNDGFMRGPPWSYVTSF